MGAIQNSSVENYIIFDNHMHLRPTGRFLDAVKMFTRSGGNAFNLVNLPEDDGALETRYSNIYSRTIDMANKVRSETSLDVLVTLGPYPLDVFLFKDHGIDPLKAMEEGIDLASKLILDGKANAIGEIGRPHFNVSDDIIELSNEVIKYAMSVCKDIGCPLILHTEDLDETGYHGFEVMARETGLALNKIVKHHASPDNVCLASPIRKSVLASRSNVREVSKCNGSFFLETDYVDDPSSGWKVIPPDSVPKRAKMIREEIADWERMFNYCFYKSPIELYGSEAFPRNF